MITVAITKKWFDEIKGRVNYADPYFYDAEPYGEMVEVDVEEKTFNKVSTELGWM